MILWLSTEPQKMITVRCLIAKCQIFRMFIGKVIKFFKQKIMFLVMFKNNKFLIGSAMFQNIIMQYFIYE